MTTKTIASLEAELAEAHQRIADLEAALALGNESLGVAFGLSRSLNSLLGCLISTPNVTQEMITMRLGIATDAKVAIHRLRMTLDAFCVKNNVVPTIKVQSRRGLGYWIEPADKERIRLITQQVIDAPGAPSVAIAVAA